MKIGAYTSAAMLVFGATEYMSGCKITIDGGFIENSNITQFEFLFRFQNTNARFLIRDFILPGRVNTSLEITSAEMMNVLFKNESGYYGPLLTDISAVNKVFINAKSADGLKVFDNYLSGYTGNFTDQTGKIVTVKNGLITTVV